MTEQRAKNFTLSLSPPFSSFIDHPPRRITLRVHPSAQIRGRKRGRADETVCSRVKTPSGHPNSPPSSPRTFTLTFHVCWLRVEAWIISAHAQWRPSRRRVKIIAIVASRSVRRGTCSRTLLLVYLDILFQFPRARQSTKSWIIFVRFVFFFWNLFRFLVSCFLKLVIFVIVHLGIA